jgi:hypothetical protein
VEQGQQEQRTRAEEERGHRATAEEEESHRTRVEEQRARAQEQQQEQQRMLVDVCVLIFELPLRIEVCRLFRVEKCKLNHQYCVPLLSASLSFQSMLEVYGLHKFNAGFDKFIQKCIWKFMQV